MSSSSSAVRGLVSAHYATVHHAALKWGMSEADAQDLTQAVWETVLRRLSEYDQGRPFPVWILGIAYQIARNYRRMQGRAQRIFDRGKDPARVHSAAHIGPATPEDELARTEEIAIAVEVIEGLPPELRTVFLLAEAEKLRQEEIAARLGLPKTTVADRLRTAWSLIERAIHRRRLAGMLAAILAAGISSLTAARAEARALVPRARMAGRRMALHVAAACAIGIFPMTGAALPVATPARSSQAPQRVVEAPGGAAGHTGPAHVQSEPAPMGVRAGILSGVQAPSRPPAQAHHSRALPSETIGEKACGEKTAKPDRCEPLPEAPPSKLAGELMLLQRVRSALRAGNVALARRVLQGYDKQYPRGILRRERDQLAAEIAARLTAPAR